MIGAGEGTRGKVYNQASGARSADGDPAGLSRDLSDQVPQDDVFARLLTFPNVLITSHQGFLTLEALERIAETTLENVRAFERGEPLRNEVHAEEMLSS